MKKFELTKLTISPKLFSKDNPISMLSFGNGKNNSGTIESKNYYSLNGPKTTIHYLFNTPSRDYVKSYLKRERICLGKVRIS